MTILFPVSGGFIRLAGHFVDDAFGFMAGWNFFLYEAILIPFEITALTTVLGYWSDNIPSWSIPIACIVSSHSRDGAGKPTQLLTGDLRFYTGETFQSGNFPMRLPDAKDLSTGEILD
jgi:amino acid transporter